MDTKELIKALRGWRPGFDVDAEDVVLLEAAADALEKALECPGALCEKRLVSQAPTPQGAVLFLRRELEGHYTLLLEGPGTPRRALGLVMDDPEECEGRVNAGNIEDMLTAHHATDIAEAVATAWEKGLAR
ncbi:MAG: hypothetical protein WC683_19840 [bacterium]